MTPRNSNLSRRSFLTLTTSGSLVMAVARLPFGLGRVAAAAAAPGGRPPTRSTLLVRPDDQLRVTFELLDLAVDGTSNTLVSVGPAPAVRMVFTSQHTVEDPIPAADTPSTTAAAHRSAAGSRVVVTVPDGTPFTVASLLDLAAYGLVLDARATGGAGSGEPSLDVTAIELPESLVWSPDAAARFVAETGPVTHEGVTELWRARLGHFDGTGVAEPPLCTPLARAIYSRPADPPFDRPVTSIDRANLVSQTVPAGDELRVNQLWLSSLGAFADLDGAWAAGVLAAYRHRVITGRDVHVEVLTRGYIAPFGHPATITTVTERGFEPDTGGGATASLAQDSYLTVNQTRIAYPYDFMPYDGRALPFTAIDVVAVPTTPVTKTPLTLGGPRPRDIDIDHAWLVSTNGTDAAVSYRATDRGGQAGITFTLPAVFVTDTVAYQAAATVGKSNLPSVLADVAEWYAHDAADAQKELVLGNQPVTWADASGRGAAGSVQNTSRIRLQLDRPALDGTPADDATETFGALGRPAFYAGVERAWVLDDAAATLADGTGAETEVVPAQRWLDHGVDDENVDLAYLSLVAEHTIGVSSTASGMVAPALKVQNFGQRFGPGIDLTADAPTWDPAEALDDVGMFLGNILLKELVEAFNAGSDLLGSKGLPTMNVEIVPGANVFDPPSGICFHFLWEPTLKSWPGSDTPTFVIGADPVFGETEPLQDTDFGGQPTAAKIAVTTCTPASHSTEIALERFALQLPPGSPAVVIAVRKLRYSQDNSAEGQLETDVKDWRFVNYLGWLEPIKDFLLEILELLTADFSDGIKVNADLPIPPFSIGVVGVRDIHLELDLDFPTAGESSIHFALARRSDPFAVTVFGFGGTGSFELRFSGREIVFIEGSMAVTFELSVNVVVVGASLSAALGSFVTYDENGVTLGAYVELRGSATFLGLVDLTGKVTLTLSYNIPTKVLTGSAVVTLEVDSLFGKSDVSYPAEVSVALGDGGGARSFGPGLALGFGPASSATFGDHFTSAQWTEYCDAFA